MSNKVKKTFKTKKKERSKVPYGKIFINTTFNNTIVTITDKAGNTICWASSGTVEFKGSRKSTPYAAQLAVASAVEKAKQRGMISVEVFVKGPGIGRESALRALGSSKLKITLIKDITPVPHNGCRPRKSRRI